MSLFTIETATVHVMWLVGSLSTCAPPLRFLVAHDVVQLYIWGKEHEEHRLKWENLLEQLRRLDKLVECVGDRFRLQMGT